MAFPFESERALRGVTLRPGGRVAALIITVMLLFAGAVLAPLSAAREPDVRCTRAKTGELVCQITTGSRLWTSTVEMTVHRPSGAKVTYVNLRGNQLDLTTTAGPVTLIPPQPGMAGLSLDRLAGKLDAFLAGHDESFAHLGYASLAGFRVVLLLASLIELSLLALLLHRVGVQLDNDGRVFVWRRIGPLPPWRSKPIPLAELTGVEVTVERRGGALLQLRRRDGGRVSLGGPGDRRFNVAALQALLFPDPR